MTSEIGKFVETLVEDGQKDLVSSVKDTSLGVISNKEECGVPLLSNIKNITKDLLVIESDKSNATNQELEIQSSLTKTIKPINIHCSTDNDRKNIEFSNSDIVVINNGNAQEYTMSNVDTTIENNDNQTGFVSTSVKQYDADIDNQLPETVTLLKTPDGGKLYLVGTAHFSIESQNDVSKIIQAVQPHIVVVELCRARVGILQLDEQVMYRYAKDLNFQCIQGTFKEYGLYNGLLNILLLKMIAHITKELGMAPGGEFRRAFEEAKKVPYCMLHMGDRPINITIQRALRFLSWWQTIKLAWHLIMIRDPISKEDVELCKQRAFLDDMLAKMSVEFPVLGEVFVKERDIYLTYSLQLACLPKCTSSGLEPARVVGVVGLGHIPGIVENWCKVKPSDIPPIMSIPPLSLSTKVLKFTFKASLVSAIIYIGYKIIPLASIKSSVQGLLKHIVCISWYLKKKKSTSKIVLIQVKIHNSYNMISLRKMQYNNMSNVSRSLTVPLDEKYFTCFCKKYTSETRDLVLKGHDLFVKVGKRLGDSDMELLLIFLRKHQDIVSLNLAYNQISCIGFKNLVTHLLVYKNIYMLNVQNNNIMEEGIDYFCEVGHELPIKSLQLSGNKFGVASSKKIALLLLKNSHLENLDIAEVDQTISSLTYFTTVMRSDQTMYNKTLKILDISRPNPGCMLYFNAEQFADLIGHMLKYNTCLSALHLQKYGFNCHDIECMIISAQYNNSLNLLDLGCNNIGDHGIHYLTNWLIKSSALHGLILSNNIITDHGARMMSYGIPFSKLKLLDISFNRITDNGIVSILNSLKKITPMKSLKIFGNTLGHIAAKVVQRMLLSKVLYQTHLDVKPYQVEDKWYCAQYPIDFSKEYFKNIKIM